MTGRDGHVRSGRSPGGTIGQREGPAGGIDPPASGRVFFVNRFFHPDLSATSQMLSDLAFSLAARGVDVHVVTSRMRYEDAEARLAPSETTGGVRIHRVATSRLGRGRIWARLIDYATFYLSMLWALLRLTRRGDTLVLKTDPPLMSIPVVPLARLKGVRVLSWYQDVFPEVIEAAGLRFAPAPLERLVMGLLKWLRDRSLGGSGGTVVIGSRMRELLHGRLPDHPLSVIPNWIDTEAIVPIEHAANPLRRAWNPEGRFVVAYSGNMGAAHRFEGVLDAAERLREDRRILFLFVGGGLRRPWLEAEVARRALGETVQFRPYQPRERLAEALAVGDVHLVVLDPAMEGLVLPSKLYGVGAAARPTLFVGDTDGEIARELATADSGASVAIDDGVALAETIRAYADDPSRCRREGRNARERVLGRYTLERSCEAWRVLLAERMRMGG